MRDNGELVAAGRELADGADCSYICDVALLSSNDDLDANQSLILRLAASTARI